MSTKPHVRDFFDTLDSSEWELDEFTDRHFDRMLDGLTKLRGEWKRGELDNWSMKNCAQMTEMMGRITRSMLEAYEEE